VIDYNHVELCLCSCQPETKLLFESGRKVRAQIACLRNRWRSGIGRRGHTGQIGCVFESKIVFLCKPSLVDYWMPKLLTQLGRDI